MHKNHRCKFKDLLTIATMCHMVSHIHGKSQICVGICNLVVHKLQKSLVDNEIQSSRKCQI
jgi:hypothetical protein